MCASCWQPENFRRAGHYTSVISFNESARVNKLYYGDNLAVLRNDIGDESVDLIYLDPPFNSQATYNVLFRSTSGEQSHAQIEAFEDTWHWGEQAERAFDEVMQSGNSDAAEILRAMRSFLKENAKIGVFITLADSTGPMRTEAVKTGFYETLYGKYPKIQILTIRELFEGRQPNIPLVDSSAFKKAATEKRGDQDALPF